MLCKCTLLFILFVLNLSLIFNTLLLLLVGWRSLVIIQMQSTFFLKTLSESFFQHVLVVRINAMYSDGGLGHLCHSVRSANTANILKNGRASLWEEAPQLETCKCQQQCTSLVNHLFKCIRYFWSLELFLTFTKDTTHNFIFAMLPDLQSFESANTPIRFI